MQFGTSILEWYDKYKRPLPWRETSDPYKIWVSEVILQQTRVGQGLDYYHRFLDKFPDINALAKAPSDEVMKVWQGLGYYSRARHMQETAEEICEKYGGRFPSTFNEMLRLKGIGDYSASAIASIAFNESSPVVDGNVLRVISRFYGIDQPINSVKVKKQVKRIMEDIIDKERPGMFNQAVMELGALVCLPKNPKCGTCPLNSDCFALKNSITGILPVKEIAKPKKVHHFNYLVLIVKEDGGIMTWLHKRTGQGIWRNLYDFPLIETPEEIDTGRLLAHPDFLRITGGFPVLDKDIQVETVRHILSHKDLRVKFFIVEASSLKLKATSQNLQSSIFNLQPSIYTKINLYNWRNYPVPRVIENCLKKLEEDRVYF